MILLMLDYDGTLAPIAKRPWLAKMGPSMKRTLGRLSERNDIIMAVISGRSLAEIKKLIGLDNVFYGGCHGLEMEGPGWRYAHPDLARMAGHIARLERDLRREMAGQKKILIENKACALTLHYRLASPKVRDRLESAVERIAPAYRPWLKVEPGRMIYEFKPAIDWDKGRAVELIQKLYADDNPFPIYIGDDITDESAFKALRGRGLTILVDNDERPKQTSAVLRLKSVSQAGRFLSSLI